MKDGLARARSRRESLRELQETRAGYTEGVRAVLSASSRDEALALVAEILEIPAEYERAVAAVLGEHIQAVIMRDHGAARDAVQALRRAGAGRVTCLSYEGPHGRPAAAPAGSLRALLDLVRVRAGFEGVARALLGNAFLVDDLDAALATWGNGDAGWTLVTPAGETLAASGAIAGGSERSEEMLLAQRRELRGLDEEVERREGELRSARARQDELTTLTEEREAALRDVDAELTQVAVSVVAAEKDLQRSRQEMREIQEQQRVVSVELGEVAAQLTGQREQTQRLEHARTEASQLRDGCNLGVAAAERRLSPERRESVTRLQEARTSRRISLADAHASGCVDRGDRSVGADGREAEHRATSLLDRQRVDRMTLRQTRESLEEAQGAYRTSRRGGREASSAQLVTVEDELRRVRDVTEGAEAPRQ
jgi:chromosome segregation protein